MQDYQVRWVVPTDDILMHHGTKGQKWGIRKYQNADGSLTSEGRRHYGIGERLRRVKDYMTTTDEKGKLHLSKEGKRIAIGAGAGAAAIGAGVGAAVLAKNGAFKGLGKSISGARSQVKSMSNQDLANYMNRNVNMSLKAITGRNTMQSVKDASGNITQLGGNISKGVVSGASKSARMSTAVRGAAKNVVATKEYGARKVNEFLKNSSKLSTKAMDAVASEESHKIVDETLKNGLKNYTSKMLMVGAVASVGLTAYNAKQKVNEEDPTGEKGRYMYPNPNKKK